MEKHHKSETSNQEKRLDKSNKTPPEFTNMTIAGKIHHEWVDVSPTNNGDFPAIVMLVFWGVYDTVDGKNPKQPPGMVKTLESSSLQWIRLQSHLSNFVHFFVRRVRWSFWPLLRCQLFGESRWGKVLAPDWWYIQPYPLWEDVLCCCFDRSKNMRKRLQIRRYFCHRSSNNLALLLWYCWMAVQSHWSLAEFDGFSIVLMGFYEVIQNFSSQPTELLRPYCWMGVLSWFMKQRHVLLWRRKLLRNIQEQMPVGVLCKNAVENSAFDVNLVWGDQKGKKCIHVWSCMYIHPQKLTWNPKIGGCFCFSKRDFKIQCFGWSNVGDFTCLSQSRRWIVIFTVSPENAWQKPMAKTRTSRPYFSTYFRQLVFSPMPRGWLFGIVFFVGEFSWKNPPIFPASHVSLKARSTIPTTQVLITYWGGLSWDVFKVQQFSRYLNAQATSIFVHICTLTEPKN